MTNTIELEMAIRKMKLTKKQVAEYLGLSEQGFLMKTQNKTEFKASEIEALCKLLHLPDKAIFFESERE